MLGTPLPVGSAQQRTENHLKYLGCPQKGNIKREYVMHICLHQVFPGMFQEIISNGTVFLQKNGACGVFQAHEARALAYFQNLGGAECLQSAESRRKLQTLAETRLSHVVCPLRVPICIRNFETCSRDNLQCPFEPCRRL